MSTTTIHPPTSRGAHRGTPDGDAAENIRALHRALDGIDEYQRIAETAQAENLVLRNQILDLIAQHDDARRLAATYRAQLVQGQLADRLRSIEADLLDENRLLREQIEDLRARLGVVPDGPRGRRRRP